VHGVSDAGAARYLPPDVSEACTDETDGTRGDNIAIVMRPERWNTSDFQRPRGAAVLITSR
jgi:hypothetical protein